MRGSLRNRTRRPTQCAAPAKSGASEADPAKHAGEERPATSSSEALAFDRIALSHLRENTGRDRFYLPFRQRRQIGINRAHNSTKDIVMEFGQILR
jgi:hypothetical protein